MSSIRIGDWAFDWYRYDADADVLYLSMGPPREGYGEETPEGHFLRFDDQGRFYGVTLVDAHRIRDESDGELGLTLPKRESIELPDAVFA